MNKMYSLYVGQFKSPSASKDCLKKLNNLGYKGFLFSRGTHYALKVYSSPNLENVASVRYRLESKGFQTEVDSN